MKIGNSNYSRTKELIGRWVTVKWDDIGRKDCLIVRGREMDNGRLTKRSSFSVFIPFHDNMDSVDADQIVEVRGYCVAG